MKRMNDDRLIEIKENLWKMLYKAEEEKSEDIGFIELISSLITEMSDMGNSDVHFSDDNLGVSITRDYIDFVDIKSGTSLGTLRWE